MNGVLFFIAVCYLVLPFIMGCCYQIIEEKPYPGPSKNIERLFITWQVGIRVGGWLWKDIK